MYCAHCKQLIDGLKCPHCGTAKVRVPLADDECFLAETGMLIGEILADVLRKEGIPFYYKSTLGAGLAMCVGPYQAVYRFYVPYRYWEQAQAHAVFLCQPPADTEFEDPQEEL